MYLDYVQLMHDWRIGNLNSSLNKCLKASILQSYIWIKDAFCTFCK